MTAEGNAQVERATAGARGDLLAGAAEGADIRAAKLVDALLGIADDKKRTASVQVGQRLDDAPLRAVGVLEFIDQKMFELNVAIASLHSRGCKRLGRQALQIVKVEPGIGVLARAIGFPRAAQQLAPERQHLRRQAVDGAGHIADFFQRVSDSGAQISQQTGDFRFCFGAAPILGRTFVADGAVAVAGLQHLADIAGISGLTDFAHISPILRDQFAQCVVGGQEANSGQRVRFLRGEQPLARGEDRPRPLLQPGFKQRVRFIRLGRMLAADEIHAIERLANAAGVIVGEKLVMGRFDSGQDIIDRFAQQDGGVRLVQHFKLGVQAGMRRVGPQDISAKTVNGVDARAVHLREMTRPLRARVLARALFELLTQALSHLISRFARECDRHQGVERPLGIVFQHLQIAIHQDPRFARAGARHHDQVPIANVNGVMLFRGVLLCRVLVGAHSGL